MLSGEIAATIEGSGDDRADDSGIGARRVADEACLAPRRVDLRAITIVEA